MEQNLGVASDRKGTQHHPTSKMACGGWWGAARPLRRDDRGRPEDHLDQGLAKNKPYTLSLRPSRAIADPAPPAEEDAAPAVPDVSGVTANGSIQRTRAQPTQPAGGEGRMLQKRSQPTGQPQRIVVAPAAARCICQCT